MKERIIIILFFIEFVISLVGCSKEGDLKVNYNNDIEPDLVINEVYNQSDIETLEQDLSLVKGGFKDRKIYYKDLKLKFKIECVRKTFQGYYVVLILDNNERAFLFMNDNLELTDIIRIEKFHKKSDFTFIKTMQTTENEMEQFDKNYIKFSLSYKDITGHILSDGVMIVYYNRMDYMNSLVESVEFISNEEIKKLKNVKADDKTTLGNEIFAISVPYILPIDKT